MHIERLYYLEKKENGLDTQSILSRCADCELSQRELEIGREAFERAHAMMEMFECAHPRIESAERRAQFERAAQTALEMAELAGMDICVHVDMRMTGQITLTGDNLLLRREQDMNFLPLMKKLMDMCDECYVDTVEKYGENLICLSFAVPLYVRGIAV